MMGYTYDFILCFVLFALHLASFFVFSTLLAGRLKVRWNAGQKLVFGYYLYFLFFYLICLPMKFAHRKVSSLALVWALVLAGSFALTGILHFRKKREKQIRLAGTVKRAEILVAGLLILFLVTCMNLNQNAQSPWDETFYMGEVATNVRTDTLAGYNRLSGEAEDFFQDRHALEITENHSAVFSKMTGIQPMAEARTVYASVNMTIFYLTVCLIGGELFPDRKRSSELSRYQSGQKRTRAEDGGSQAWKRLAFLFFFALLDLFSYNHHTRAQLIFFRPYEGKAVLANLILFVIFYLFLLLLGTEKGRAGRKDGHARDSKGTRREERSVWIMLFVVIASSMGLNLTSQVLVPPLVGALMLPVIIGEKKWKWILYLAVCMLPWAVNMVIYLKL